MAAVIIHHRDLLPQEALTSGSAVFTTMLIIRPCFSWDALGMGMKVDLFLQNLGFL